MWDQFVMRSRGGVALVLMLLMAFNAHAQQPDLFEEVQLTLSQKGLAYDHAAARQAATLALVKQADPLGDVVDEATWKQRVKHSNGMVYSSGMHLVHTNGLCFVNYIDSGSPAVHAGVKARSYILEIDGTEVTECRMSDILRRMRSAQPQTLAVKLLDEDDHAYSVNIQLQALQLDAIELREEFPRNISYLKMNGLYKNAGTEVVNLIARWNSLKRLGMILDLRNADGRDLEAVRQIAGTFANKEQVLFSVALQGEQTAQVYHPDRGDDINLPTMILVNGQTRGAAELLAATLQAAGRGAMVLGEQTPGDFALRDFIPLSDGHHLYVADKTIALRDDWVLDGHVGLKPDILVADTDLPTPQKAVSFRSARKSTQDEDAVSEALQLRIQNDAVLQRAVDVLLGLKALNFRASGASK